MIIKRLPNTDNIIAALRANHLKQQVKSEVKSE